MSDNKITEEQDKVKIKKTAESAEQKKIRKKYEAQQAKLAKAQQKEEKAELEKKAKAQKKEEKKELNKKVDVLQKKEQEEENKQKVKLSLSGRTIGLIVTGTICFVIVVFGVYWAVQLRNKDIASTLQSGTATTASTTGTIFTQTTPVETNAPNYAVDDHTAVYHPIGQPEKTTTTATVGGSAESEPVEETQRSDGYIEMPDSTTGTYGINGADYFD